jgi:hypothetical protein
MTETNERQVRTVFANFKVKTTLQDGRAGVGLKSKVRGEMIDVSTLADGELERLERNGALMPEGAEVTPGERLEEALRRALNPLDVMREDAGPPLSVSPPPLGAPPRGDFTKGDTGVDPADQPPPDPAERVVTINSAEQEALDRLRAESAEENVPRTDAPDVEDTAALSEFIKSERLNASETVALAEGDPDRARHVLEAEKTATGHDPRRSVTGPLQKIIDGQ